tara:strand:- start:1169 stop:1345 length:177 start_codon:yes stop_codon:yes gene_type:complete
MKEIINQSLQGQMVFFQTPKGAKGFWLSPQEHMIVPSSFLSSHTEALQVRSLISVKDA